MSAAKKRLLLVDGYNVLGAWPSLTRGRTFEESRAELTERLHDYAGYSGQTVVLVFDAWRSERKTRTSEDMGSLRVVFTQHGETADHYIERFCDEHVEAVKRGREELRVATSDGVEQTVVLGRGAIRLSARELIYEVEHRAVSSPRPTVKRAGGSTVMERMPEEIRNRLEKMRRGET